MTKNVIKILQLQLPNGLASQASLIYKKKTRVWQSQICPYASGVLSQSGNERSLFYETLSDFFVKTGRFMVYCQVSAVITP
jgi:hypothetical protein